MQVSLAITPEQQAAWQTLRPLFLQLDAAMTTPPAPPPAARKGARICQLAYAGTPMDADFNVLLPQTDLCICNAAYLAHARAIAPSVPLLIYSNASNIYSPLLDAWLLYAGSAGLNPEAGFLHSGGTGPGARVPYLGQANRWLTNPSSPDFRAWCVQWHKQYLAGQPLASGLFLDNTIGNLATLAPSFVEPLTAYAADYASLVGLLRQGCGLVVPNTAGNYAPQDATIQAAGWGYQEGALRALAHTWSDFEYVSNLIWHRYSLPGSPTIILDSHPAAGAPADPRTQLATLAYYLLLATPQTMLNFFGGYAPATSWAQHWCPAAAYDLGAAPPGWAVFATGADPAEPTLTHKVYGRRYAGGLVLYKPRSYAQGKGAGSTGDATATTHSLPGSYRALDANGVPWPPVTSVTLRNGEGAILVGQGP